MDLAFKINSLYICVKDMERAIGFYEKLLGQKVKATTKYWSL